MQLLVSLVQIGDVDPWSPRDCHVILTSSDHAEALLPQEAPHVCLGLTYLEIAEAVGPDECSPFGCRWWKLQLSPVFARQIRGFGRCLNQLAREFGSRREARGWIASRPDRLDGERPVYYLRDEQTDRVIVKLHLMNAAVPT